MRSFPSRTPIEIDPAFGDRAVYAGLVRAGSPFFTVQRYLRNLSELASLSQAGSGTSADAPMMVAPWFRGDLADRTAGSAGARAVLGHTPFVEAARALFGLPVVVPVQLYLNLNPPIPQLDPGHVDVPTFRGVDRTNTPVWLLAIMMKSGLFERWYVPTATAVAWCYDGEGGGFRFWPDGPDAPPVDRTCRTDTALVGDNDRMFHAVLAVGSPRGLVRGMTLASTLVADDDTYRVVEAGTTLATYARDEVRISVSWKALCFADEGARIRFDRNEDAIDHAEVVRVICADLAARGLDATPPREPLGDRSFVERLNAAYGFGPTAFAPRSIS